MLAAKGCQVMETHSRAEMSEMEAPERGSPSVSQAAPAKDEASSWIREKWQRWCRYVMLNVRGENHTRMVNCRERLFLRFIDCE